MADAITLQRLARTLEQTASATSKGENFWQTLAQAAANAIERPPAVTQAPLPAQPFIAVIRSGDGFQIIARGTTLAELQAPAETYLQAHGVGTAEIWAAEIKRVFQVA